MPAQIKNPDSIRNITRFDYDTTGFQGWRVCKSIKGVTFCRYFPDRDHKGSYTRRKQLSKKKAKNVLETLVDLSKDLSPAKLKSWAKKSGFKVTES